MEIDCKSLVLAVHVIIIIIIMTTYMAQ